MSLLPNNHSTGTNGVHDSPSMGCLTLPERIHSFLRHFPRLSKLLSLTIHEYASKKIIDKPPFSAKRISESSLAIVRSFHQRSLPAMLDAIENEMRTGNHAEARALIEAALFFSPADIMLLEKLNETLIATKTRPAILPYLKKAVACDPINVDLICLSAEYCLQMKRFEIGFSFIAQALAKNVAGTSNLYRILGALENNRNNIIPAEKALRTSLAMNPANDAALVVLAHLLHTQERLAEEDSLLAEYQGAKTMQFWMAIARVKNSLDDYLAAKDAYQKAIAFPNCPPHIYLAYGRMELTKGNWEEAERLFGLYAARAPSSTSFLPHIQDLYGGSSQNPYEICRDALYYHANNNGLVFIDSSLSAPNVNTPFRKNSNGCRVTPNNPPTACNTIFFFGDSQIAGYLVDDTSTTPFFLQEEINKKKFNYKVLNMAVGGTSIDNVYLKIEKSALHRGDIIIIPLFSGPRMFDRQNDVNKKRVNYLNAIANICHKHGVRLIIIYLPTILDILNPSKREEYIKKGLIRRKTGKHENCRILSRKLFTDIANQQNGFELYSFLDIANRPHNHGEVFFDRSHFNHHIHKAIAQKLAAIIEENPEIPFTSIPRGLSEKMHSKAVKWLGGEARKRYQNNTDIREWINSVRNDKFSGLQKVGALVMNCNPFTLGHYYLIEQAAKEVDGLYIFVLQEDKSFFSFEDRIRLVREGTKSFGDAVAVHASGEFIISSMSFPGYFAKEQAIKPADSTTDVLIFGAVLAPALGITHRFVGEEPNCLVTNSYNETMQFLLPSLGIDLRIIPRKEEDGQVISASSVRKGLKENNWDLIKAIVPQTTYGYLVEKYGGQMDNTQSIIPKTTADRPTIREDSGEYSHTQ